MTDQIRNILEGMDNLHGWKLVELKKEAQELFFIKRHLDMNRSKDVTDYIVTVYVAFQQDDIRYLGQSSTEIGPGMTEEEIRHRIKDAATGASFVKNPYYPLSKPSEEMAVPLVNNFSAASLDVWMPKLARAVYRDDVHKEGGINSAEIFLNSTAKRILTSEGIDVAFNTYRTTVEVVADCNEGMEPVELFMLQDFGSYQPEIIGDKVGGLLQESRERALAVPTPTMKQMDVILTGESVRDLLAYYIGKSGARGKFEGISEFEIGQHIQGENVIGDLLNIEMLPVLEGSSKSAPYDSDGVLLKPVKLIRDGVLQTLLGDIQYGSYLDIPVTGQLTNFKVSLGSVSEDEMKGKPYIELVSFSDFQVNALTGDFGGEIRLARYFDGKEIKAMTGGAISANLKDFQADMTFSSEAVQHDYYYGPRSILFKGLEIVGR